MRAGVLLASACWCFVFAIVLDGAQSGIMLGCGLALLGLGLAEVE